MSKKLEQLFRNFMVSEGRAPGRAYVVPFHDEKGNQKGWKSSNKWGKVKYWQPHAKQSALKHAGVDEITEEAGPSYEEELPQILKDIRGKKKSHSDMRREYGSNWKRLTNATSAEHGSDYNRSHLLAVGQKHMEEMNENFMDGKGPGRPGDSARHGLKGKSASELRSIRSSETASPRKKQLAHWLLNMHHNKSVDEGLKDPEDNPCWKGYEPVGTKKKNGKTVPNCVPVSEEVPCSEPITTDPNDPTSRLIGTDSIVRVYKKATPGQMNTFKEQAHMIAVRNLIERSPNPTPRASAPQPPKPSIGSRMVKRGGGAIALGLAGKGISDDMARKRAEGKQTYGQALGTSVASNVGGGIGGWEAGWRLGKMVPGKLKYPAALAGGITGAIVGKEAIDSAGERLFHKESTDLNESYELAFDYQGKPQLAPTAGELRMQAKGAFAHHTDVQNVMDVKSIKESIQRQFELTVLEEDTKQLASKCEVLMDMVEHALDTIATIKESTVEKDAWAEAQILKLESYIISVSKYIDNILGEDSVPVIRRSYMRTDPRTGERKRVKGRVYKRRRDFDDDEDDKQDLPRGPLSV